MSTKSQHTLDSLWIKYQNTLEVLNDTLDELEDAQKEIATLKSQIVEKQEVVTDAKDYWGRPKIVGSSKQKDELTYEQQTQMRYDRIVKEAKSGALDINTLNHAEQVIVRKLMNE